MNDHAALSPSALKNYEICPSWQPLPDDEHRDTSAADRGTRLHKYLEEGIPAEISQEEKNTLLSMQDYVQDILKNIVNPIMCMEIKLDLSPYEIPGCTHGTADLLVWDGETRVLHLIDYKFGKIEVEDPETNPQIWAYVLGAFEINKKALSLVAHILQPYCDTIGTHTFLRSDIPRLRVRLQIISARVHASLPNQIPTWDNCQYCGAKAFCGALHKLALKTIQQNELATVPETLVHNEFLVMQEDVKILDPQVASTLYDLANLLESWSKSVRTTIALRDDADEIPDHSLVITSGKRTIKDPLGARDELNKLGVSDDEILSIAELPITKVEGLVSASVEKGDKKKTLASLSETLLAEGILEIGNPARYLRRSK